MGVSKIPIKQLGTIAATSTSNILPGVAVDATVFVGAIVRVSGAIFVNAIATSKAASFVFGVCVAKSTPVLGDILLPGGVTSAIYIGLDPTKEYFLSDTIAGGIAIPPVPTVAGRVVWLIGKPYIATRLLFKPVLRVVRA